MSSALRSKSGLASRSMLPTGHWLRNVQRALICFRIRVKDVKMDPKAVEKHVRGILKPLLHLVVWMIKQYNDT